MQRVRSSAGVSSVSAVALPITALPVEAASVEKSYCTQFLKDFDLPLDLELPYRVYVLRCSQARILTGGFAYYVGVIDKYGLLDRLQKHFGCHADSARFTKVNKPLGLELLWPVRSRAAEAYLFMFVLGKLDEVAVLRHGRLGGWTQTHVAPLPVAAFNSLQRDWRMVNDRCLECGLSGHKAGSALCGQAQEAAKAKASSRSSSSSMAKASQLPLALPVPVVKCAAPPHAKASAPAPAAKAKAVAPIPADDLDTRFDKWLTKKRLRDDDGWISLKCVLIALGEPWKNPRRYLEPHSDATSKIWTLGRQKRPPKLNQDYKRADSAHGGRKPFVARKSFLKKVVIERF